MTSAAANRAARKDELTKSERRIRQYCDRLFAVARRERRAFVAPSIDTIAAACGCSRSTVKRAKAKLAQLGLFTFRKRYGIQGDVAWRLPDLIYKTGSTAITRPAPRLELAVTPTRRQRVTERLQRRLQRQLASHLAWIGELKSELNSPSQGRLIFEPASTFVPIKIETAPPLPSRSSEQSIADFASRRKLRLNRRI